MADVFISYRRSDTRSDAGRLYDRLSARFGDEHVFMDVDDIEPGEDFPRVLENTLEHCDVLLVLIGPRWLDPSGDDHGARLHDPADFVHLEISRALSRGIAVIPVLVGDTAMPAAGSLPAPLRDLCRRQALRIAHERFHRDVDVLIEALEASGSPWGWVKRRLRLGSRRLVAVVVVLAVLALGAGVKLALDCTGQREQARVHVQVAEAFVAEGRLERAVHEYRLAMALRPSDLELQRRLVSVSVEHLQRQAFLSAGSSLDVALRSDYSRFAPVPEQEVDAALRELSVLSALDPALAGDPDHLLTRALVLKASGVRVRDALAPLEQAHAAAPEHPGVTSELGLIRAVVMGDAGGLSLLRRAADAAQQDARIQLYLARAHAVLHACADAGTEIRRPEAPEGCTEALRAYYRAASAQGADPWSRHIRVSALRGLQDVLRRYVLASGSIVDLGMPLAVAERVAMLELMLRDGGARVSGSADEQPAFWLALLYEATGRREEARARLRALIDASGATYDAWKALQQRLDAARG